MVYNGDLVISINVDVQCSGISIWEFMNWWKMGDEMGDDLAKDFGLHLMQFVEANQSNEAIQEVLRVQHAMISEMHGTARRATIA